MNEVVAEVMPAIYAVCLTGLGAGIHPKNVCSQPAGPRLAQLQLICALAVLPVGFILGLALPCLCYVTLMR